MDAEFADCSTCIVIDEIAARFTGSLADRNAESIVPLAREALAFLAWMDLIC